MKQAALSGPIAADALRCLLLSCLAAGGFLLPVREVRAQAFNDFQIAPHSYFERERRDPMSRLLARVESGEFDYGDEPGLPLVRRLLEALEVPESSQVLLFSQGSLQRELISPANPRAIFFNEDLHLAWMPEGKIEISSFDPEIGTVFFLQSEPEAERIEFAESRRCLGCHGGSATNFLPGPMARSNYTSETGRRVASVPSHIRLSHAVPFEDRWGGYFVTNAPPTLSHLGNAFASRESGALAVDRSHASTADLGAFFDPRILPRPDSEILALMLFDHQTEMHNLLIEAVYRDRLLLHLAEANGGEAPRLVAEQTDAFFDRLVRYLLFAREVSLAGHSLRRGTDFERDFTARRRAAPSGRSLRDFDLETRLFQHRLSYMIDSQAFEEAPRTMRERTYRKLHQILAAETPPEGYDYFDDGEREAILTILKHTKADLPEDW